MVEMTHLFLFFETMSFQAKPRNPLIYA